MLKELTPPQLEGPKDADVTLVTWGSTYGVVKEAAEQLNAAGTKTNIPLHQIHLSIPRQRSN